MATVRSIVTDALQEIGAIGQGETPSGADAVLGLLRFQNQLDAWQADRLTLFTFTRTAYALPTSTVTRTIGPTGNIVVASNPVFLNAINYVVPATSPAVETPMGRMDDDSYANLSIKQLPNNLPTQWYFNPGAVNGTLTFWPVVNQGVTIAIYAYYGVGVPASLDDTVFGPPGYAEAFLYQLAWRLCTPFARPVPPLLPQNMTESFARIKRPNLVPGLLGMDPALVSRGAGYNVLNDQSSASNR